MDRGGCALTEHDWCVPGIIGWMSVTEQWTSPMEKRRLEWREGRRRRRGFTLGGEQKGAGGAEGQEEPEKEEVQHGMEGGGGERGNRWRRRKKVNSDD